MKDLKFDAWNGETQQTLAELEAWPPPQGTIPEAIPLDIELRFSEQVIRLANGEITISLSRADIQLVLEGFRIVRGSRFGDQITEPYVLSEITQTARANLDQEQESGVEVELTLVPTILGKFTGLFKRRSRRKKEEGLDSTVRGVVNKFRVIAKTKNRWTVVEPLSPNQLKGKYLGQAQSGERNEKSSPLCLLSVTSHAAKAKLFLRANPADVVITNYSNNKQRKLSKNKTAIINQLIGMSFSGGRIDGLQETPDRAGILLCHSELRCIHV